MDVGKGREQERKLRLKRLLLVLALAGEACTPAAKVLDGIIRD
jgi:hypothetical protein